MTIVDVLLHSKLQGGIIRRFRSIPCETADRMFSEQAKLLTDPFVTYYRVTLQDPDRGGYVVRDTDWEVHGIGGCAAQ